MLLCDIWNEPLRASTTAASNGVLPCSFVKWKVRTIRRTAPKIALDTHVSEKLEPAWGCLRHCFILIETGGMPGGATAMCRTCIMAYGNLSKEYSWRRSTYDGITGKHWTTPVWSDGNKRIAMSLFDVSKFVSTTATPQTDYSPTWFWAAVDRLTEFPQVQQLAIGHAIGEAEVHPCERTTVQQVGFSRPEECQLLTFAGNSMRMSACVRTTASNKSITRTNLLGGGPCAAGLKEIDGPEMPHRPSLVQQVPCPGGEAMHVSNT